MKARTFARHVREGLTNIVRNPWMSFASLGSIVTSLFVLGAFLLLTFNLNYFADTIEKQVSEINVYLQLDITEAQTQAVRQELEKLDGVAALRFVSEADALEILRGRLGEEGTDILRGMEGAANPLPSSFVVTVTEPSQIADIAAQITHPAVTDVNYGQDVIASLFRATEIVRTAGLAFVILLALTALFLISTSIHSSITVRKQEIRIMMLVGSTKSFIRWPFFVEGVVIGLGGSLVTTAVLLAGYEWLVSKTTLTLGLMLSPLLSLSSLAWPVGGILVGLGTVLGMAGSMLSLRRYLRV
jgi:cell division transport system permease protein